MAASDHNILDLVIPTDKVDPMGLFVLVLALRARLDQKETLSPQEREHVISFIEANRRLEGDSKSRSTLEALEALVRSA